MPTTTPLTKGPAWKALADHFAKIEPLHLRKRFTAEAVGVFLDYSKNRITDETLKLLVALAEERGVRAKIDAMFRGDKINITEDRAVLHVALRAPRTAAFEVDGKNIVPDVHAVLDKMTAFAKRIRDGSWRGHTGKPIK